MVQVIVYGGCGALGRVVVNGFKALQYRVISVDLKASDNADASSIITIGDDVVTQAKKVADSISATLAQDGWDDKVDGIFCVAGGWAGGNASSDEFLKNCNLMWMQSVHSSIIASQLATKFLKEGGVLQLTGAIPALAGTSGMIGYGMAKAAVHQLVKSLAAEGSGMPAGSRVYAILPETLDTPMNRKFMGTDNLSKWTPLETVASLFENWITGSTATPTFPSGTLINVLTRDSKTEFTSA